MLSGMCVVVASTPSNEPICSVLVKGSSGGGGGAAVAAATTAAVAAAVVVETIFGGWLV